MDELGIGGLDQISELPDHLLHHILSFMPTKDVVQTKLLSRTWRRVCSSYPNFEFNLHNYSQRLEQRGRWIEISLEKQVQELDIRIYKYDLPPAIFASKSLHTLCLMGITMPPIFTTNTRFFSLRKLSICGVSLKEQILQDLIFKFPFIENLALLGGINPILVKKIRVSGLCNLKELTIFGWRVLEEVDIDAPSLKFFHYGGYILQQNNIKIKMGATNNVETLSITYDTTMTEQQFYDLISKFPLLKCLHVCMWNDV
ncbi:F-box/LRR-repeat protein 13-like [Corylus avellana]|uniref:F-box/LRR-repeat protein 13-like n=1 Tax=Corylus avellana TaxID=13451 RepID=UPI00286B816C|nr:F-box/LRR-repeat protein 13-like [Corylus avellana]